MKKKFIESLKQTGIVTDGAMGTYYGMKQEGNQLVEWANLYNPKSIVTIHKEYLKSGASLIRTNTFAVNSSIMGIGKEQRKQLLSEGYRLAVQAVTEYRDESNMETTHIQFNKDRDIYVAADIGPIPIHGERTEEENVEEYKEICQTFLEQGAQLFIFETFSNVNGMQEVVDYITIQNPNACIIINFCINKNGYTMSGIHAQKLIDEVSEIENVQVCGFNCGIGSGHMVNIIQTLKFPKNKYIAVLPNAGYPEQLHNRMIFANNIRYFVENVMKIRECGVALLGGCCGTTPAYIEELARENNICGSNRSRIENDNQCKKIQVKPQAKTIVTKLDIENGKGKNKDKEILTVQSLPKDITTETINSLQMNFASNLASGKKVIAVELDPPYDSDDTKFLDCVARVKDQDVDLITIADSPMGRSRVDSILMSVKIMNQYQTPVMPHVCCRDKNMISMRSTILGAYLNGIRNMLIVTGDPVPCEQRLSITNVFDYNSIRLMEFVKQMNVEHFSENPIQYGGALNPGQCRVDKIIERMQKKIDAGATFFLTQPIYSDEVIERIHYIKQHVNTKILCGIMPFVSYRNANFIKNEFSGIVVPDEYASRYSPNMTKEEAEYVGVTMGKELMNKLEPYADGYYFMLPFNRVSLLEKILN